MASRFEIYLCHKIEAVEQTNTKKATNFGLSVFSGRWKIILRLNLQQNGKMHLTKSPKCL